jgi:hypothetical protein
LLVLQAPVGHVAGITQLPPLQTYPAAQFPVPLPQYPPQPSSPQFFPEQFGMQPA